MTLPRTVVQLSSRSYSVEGVNSKEGYYKPIIFAD